MTEQFHEDFITRYFFVVWHLIKHKISCSGERGKSTIKQSK
jgi:hypothetical protein